MAVEIHRGAAAAQQDGTVTYSRVFLVNLGVTNVRPAWGVVSIGINRYDAHPDDATALAVSVDSQPADALGYFTVTYGYTNKPFDSGSTDSTANGGAPGQSDPILQPDPTQRTPTVRWGANSRSEALELDYNPDPLLGRQPVSNSARQPIAGVETENPTGVITISFAMASVDAAAKQRSYLGTVNDGSYRPVPSFGFYSKGELKCNRWDATLQFEAGYGWYFQCEVEIEVKRGGWQRDLLDQGFYELVPGDGGYRQAKIVDGRTGADIDAPVKLNGAGRKLNPGDNPTVADPYFVVNAGTDTVAVYKTIHPFEYVSWTNLRP